MRTKVFLLILVLIGTAFAINISLAFASNNLTDGFDYPVGKPDSNGYYDAQDFGIPNPNFGGKYHLGEDWNKNCNGDCDLGDPIYSIGNGTVITKTYRKVWGNVIIIQHTFPNGDKINSFYGHLQSMIVNEGDEVKRGQLIGTMGKGDKGIFPAHLHFEIRTNISIGVDYGYSSTPKPPGWVDPSDFIDSHRPLPKATLSITNTDHETAKLSWTKPEIKNFKKYEIYCSTEAGGTSDPAKRTLIVTIENPDTLEFTDTGLSPDTEYFYSIFSYDQYDNFSQSDEASARTTTGLTNITQNKYSQIFPNISGERIVWYDYRLIDGKYPQALFYYDITKKEVFVADISMSGALYAQMPVISKNTVAFQSPKKNNLGLKENIYMYNFEKETATPISEALGDQFYSDIYENYIVWQDERKGAAESDIYMIDISSGLSGETPLVETAGRQMTPKIWQDKVVYVDTIIGGSIWDIKMIDINTKEITTMATSVKNAHPSISDGKISWLFDKKIYVYDISSGATSFYEFEGAVFSRIKNDLLIYQKDEGLGYTEIHTYNLLTTKDILIAKISQWYTWFDLDGEYLVYDDPGEDEMSDSWKDIFIVKVK